MNLGLLLVHLLSTLCCCSTDSPNLHLAQSWSPRNIPGKEIVVTDMENLKNNICEKEKEKKRRNAKNSRLCGK